MGKNMKGQAAMEYLMTYGWAILVLVIVLAALWYLLPSTQERCIFDQGTIECEGGVAQIYIVDPDGDGSGELVVAATLHNNFGQTISNIQVLCTNIGKGDVDTTLFQEAALAGTLYVHADNVGPGASFDAVPVPCIKEDASQIISNEGASFKGVIAIRYSLDSDVNPDIQHITTGSLSGTVIK